MIQSQTLANQVLEVLFAASQVVVAALCAVSWDGVGLAVSHTLVQVGTIPPRASGDSPLQKTGIRQAQSSYQCRSCLFL